LGEFKPAGALLDALIEILIPLTQMHIALVQLIQPTIEVNRNLSNFVAFIHSPGSSAKLATLDLGDCSGHPLKRLEDFGSPSQE
jgi:hypothetical protein